MEYNVVVKPQPGSQSLAVSCPCNEILYEGTRGPGKTAAQLMRFRARVGLGYGAFWRGIIFDIEYKNLDDIIAQSKKLFNKFEDGARFLESADKLKWVWPSGEELLFRYAKKADDYWNYHGQEYPSLGFNELTKRPDAEFYEMMFSCMRSSFLPEDHPRPDGSLLPPIPLECFSTTNPYGPGHSWVKKRFIDPVPRGTVQRDVVQVPDTSVTDPNATKDVTLTRVAIHGSWKENRFLDAAYIAYLMSIKDPNRRKAWVDGDWSVTAGGRFDYLWREDVHGVKPFTIPPGWRVDRSFDWGEAKPFSCLWFAESNGEGGYPAGTIFLIAEFYGCEVDQHNVGLRMTSSNVAKTIKQIDASLVDGSTVDEKRGQINLTPGIAEGHDVLAGPADNAIFTPSDNQASIADKMAAQGVYWLESDKRPGSRINGAAIICEMLEAAIEGDKSESGKPERPAVYVFNNVRGFISRFPILSRDTKRPDDVDTDQEDHDYDAFRYRVSSGVSPEISIGIKRRY